MTRPRLLDLYSGAGGSAMGYYRAGFDVVGVDIISQPRYPFLFVQADALDFLRRNWRHFAAIHASPPCQAFTALRVMPNARRHVDLLTPAREAILATGLPYVIENVEGAPLRDPVRLCGTAFGLGVQVYDGWRELRRHRLFETSFPILVPPCQHRHATIGIYGDHARDRRRKHGSRGVDFSRPDSFVLGKAALGMPWAQRWRELCQAIPPAYTEFIGAALLRHLEREEASA